MCLGQWVQNNNSLVFDFMSKKYETQHLCQRRLLTMALYFLAQKSTPQIENDVPPLQYMAQGKTLSRPAQMQEKRRKFVKAATTSTVEGTECLSIDGATTSSDSYSYSQETTVGIRLSAAQVSDASPNASKQSIVRRVAKGR